MELKGSVVVVTGGASGLGAGAAEHLRDAGATVAVLDLTTSTVPEDVHAHEVDITDEDAVGRTLDRVVEELGPLRAVVNSAGVTRSHLLFGDDGRFPTDLFRWTVDVNLTGSFIVMAQAAERMSRNEPNADGERGAVVNVASIAAFEGSSSIAYAASKGGVVSMSLTAARDLARYGIRVNAIAPGPMDTAMIEGVDDAYREAIISKTAFPKRLGHPQEFGALVAHLIENSYLNGTSFRIDAGTRV